MKRLILISILSLFTLTSFAQVDNDTINTDYQAACIYRQILDELIIHMDEHERSEADEIISGVLENLDCYESITITREEIETCYKEDFVQ